MRHLAWLFCAMLFLGPIATPAHAVVSLGANLGVSIYDPSDGDGVTMIGVPSQTGLISSVRPGLRFGFAGQRLNHEGFLDLSLDTYASDGDELHSVRLAGNYQYNFGGSGGTRPYLTAGVGLLNQGGGNGETVGATSLTYGGALGVGFPVSDGSGRLRLEVRLDRVEEGEDGSLLVIQAANVFNVTFGFDLWMK